MRVHDNNTRVTFDANDIERFARQWPCSGFRYGDRVSVSVDGTTGDLTDYTVNGRFPAPLRIDDNALLAVTYDANNIIAKRVGEPVMARPYPCETVEDIPDVDWVR